jgi:toxin CcdB
MAQFDVHRNPGRNRAAIPFVVVVQSASFDHAATRLVAPLVVSGADEPWRYPARLPRFMIEGQTLALDPLLLQAVPRAALGPVVASLANEDDAFAIITAIDQVLSRTGG